MPVTETPRLKFRMQDPGDVDWGTELNAGLLAADNNFMQLGTLSPNGLITGAFTFQLYFQFVSPPVVWMCITGGTTTWQRLSQLPTGAVMDYASALSSKDNGGTARELIKMMSVEGPDIVVVGAATSKLRFRSNSINNLTVDYGVGPKIVLHDSNAVTVLGLLALAFKALPTRSFTRKASDELFTTSLSAEKIIASFDRLDFPGTKDAANKYMLHGNVSVTGTSAFNEEYTVRARMGSTGNGLTDPVVFLTHAGPGSEAADFSLGVIQEVQPDVNDRVTLTVQRPAGGSDYTVKATNTLLEVLEVLD